MTVTKAHVSDEGTLMIEASIPADGRNEEIARAFFEEADRRGRISHAVVDYERRVVESRPYEDAVSIDDLTRDLGR